MANRWDDPAIDRRPVGYVRTGSHDPLTPSQPLIGPSLDGDARERRDQPLCRDASMSFREPATDLALRSRLESVSTPCSALRPPGLDGRYPLAAGVLINRSGSFASLFACHRSRSHHCADHRGSHHSGAPSGQADVARWVKAALRGGGRSPGIRRRLGAPRRPSTSPRCSWPPARLGTPVTGRPGDRARTPRQVAG